MQFITNICNPQKLSLIKTKTPRPPLVPVIHWSLGIPDTLLGLFQGCSQAFGHLTFQPNPCDGKDGGRFSNGCLANHVLSVRTTRLEEQGLSRSSKGIFFMKPIWQKQPMGGLVVENFQENAFL